MHPPIILSRSERTEECKFHLRLDKLFDHFHQYGGQSGATKPTTQTTQTTDFSANKAAQREAT